MHSYLIDNKTEQLLLVETIFALSWCGKTVQYWLRHELGLRQLSCFYWLKRPSCPWPSTISGLYDRAPMLPTCRRIYLQLQ